MSYRLHTGFVYRFVLLSHDAQQAGGIHIITDTYTAAMITAALSRDALRRIMQMCSSSAAEDEGTASCGKEVSLAGTKSSGQQQ